MKRIFSMILMVMAFSAFSFSASAAGPPGIPDIPTISQSVDQVANSPVFIIHYIQSPAQSVSLAVIHRDPGDLFCLYDNPAMAPREMFLRCSISRKAIKEYKRFSKHIRYGNTRENGGTSAGGMPFRRNTPKTSL